MGKLKTAGVSLISAVFGAVVATIAWGAGIQYTAIIEARKLAFQERAKAIDALYPVSGGIDVSKPEYNSNVRRVNEGLAADGIDLYGCDPVRSFSCDVKLFLVYNDAREWCATNDYLNANIPPLKKENAEIFTLKFKYRQSSEEVRCSQLERGMNDLHAYMKSALIRVNQTSLSDVFLCTVAPSGEDCRLAGL